MQLEATDKKILNILVDNSRLSLRKIAKKADVSVATVMHHIKKLEKEGIIKKYTTKLDYEKTGYDVEVIIEIRISKGKLFEVEKKIAMHPNVVAVYDITGKADILLIGKFKNRDELSHFIKSISAIPNVENTETHIVLNTIKEDFRLS